MAEPTVELAAVKITRLLEQAAELDWAGEHERADILRREAKAIEARKEIWTTNF
jgi:hypothetical protein